MIDQKLRKPLADLLDAAKDVVEQYEKTHLVVGVDLSDSIRVFLKPAVAKAEKALGRADRENVGRR